MSLFDKLNLRPQERRLVVIVGLVVFFVLNLWLVWPQFSEWSKQKKRKGELEAMLLRFQNEIKKAPDYKKQLDDLERQGQAVLSEEQAVDLQKVVYSQAALVGIFPSGYEPGSKSSTGRTNQFFEEQSGTITVLTEEKPLVDFLYNLGAGNSLIRVRSMNLVPDPTRMKLAGTITLVASYQKKAPPKLPPPVKTTNATNAPKSGTIFTKTNSANKGVVTPSKK